MNPTLDEVMRLGARACVTAGLIAGAVVFARTRAIRPALAMALEFWLAAGLLTLSLATTWAAVLSAASIVAIRHLLTRSLSQPTTRQPPAASPKPPNDVAV